MREDVRRGAAAVALAAVVGLGVVGCTDEDGVSPSDLASRVASAASDAASSADRKLDELTDGVNVKDAARLGSTTTDDDGRATVPVTVENTEGSEKSFAVRVNFRDEGGNLLDVVVVTVSDVPAGQSGEGTARSSRSLSGEVQAEVGRVVRY
ncbi:FxLYD domain-containing protein [Streptomyces apocyni]|uniref:FxLYD domain-containing protein n=1 Tax=Streptomyces apocyni TaxID=2654677 RepID=UPI0012EAC4EF|nr:FxLYD domain-containing protein [Streptomyces apocyni]